MEIYLIFLIVIVALAVLDLIVGVSNDAVNFMNSAVGSNAGKYKLILLISAIGILIGAVFSGGMMEVVRKGIFNPELFGFTDVMVIFAAVMFSDVILLDLYNSLALPTSTTVSLVFELLGGAFAIALIKVLQSTDAGASIYTYINSEKALEIILGIFISIGIAFLCGMIFQFLFRLLFTFNYKKTLKYVGSLFSAIAFTTISYFILIKGLKGSTLLPREISDFLTHNTLIVMGMFFAFFLIVSQILISFTKVNILKVIVLSGTFSLALAFASNDLVNFIGVASAAINSYQIALNEGTIANLMMGDLANPVRADLIILIVSGVIMILTLFYSKKAKNVTKTEVQLATQGKSKERFKGSLASSAIVKIYLVLFDAFYSLLPNTFKNKIADRFRVQENDDSKSSFDLVRASVNLVVASSLISLGTSLKLPLSTTFVTFMVAMGTSLSDGAWGRHSAENRVSGVLAVIGGWILTALIAFTFCFTLTNIIYFGNIYAVLGLSALLVFILIRFKKITTND